MNEPKTEIELTKEEFERIVKEEELHYIRESIINAELLRDM